MTSLGGADPDFPSEDSGLPPSPSSENPGQVFPKSNPSKAQKPSPRRTTPDRYVGNPFLMKNALDKVDHEFNAVIAILEQEAGSQGRSTAGGQEDPLLHKFRAWRDELLRMRLGEGQVEWSTTPQDIPKDEGGMFAD